MDGNNILKYNIQGKMNPTQLDLSGIASGTYNIVMTFDGRTLIKTIVKE